MWTHIPIIIHFLNTIIIVIIVNLGASPGTASCDHTTASKSLIALIQPETIYSTSIWDWNLKSWNNDNGEKDGMKLESNDEEP